MNTVQLFQAFQVIWNFFAGNWQKKNSHFVPKRNYLWKMLRITRNILFFSNEFETGHILSKKVMNIKMSHIGKFISNLVFCIIFVGNYLKIPLCGKKWLSPKNAHNWRKRLFFIKYVKLDNAKNYFMPHIEPHTFILSFSGVLKHFCLKLQKKTLIWVQKETLSETS